MRKRDDKPTTHVLHLLHSCYLPEEEEPKSDEDTVEVLKNFKYSATELDFGGIEFVQGNKRNIFDIKFVSKYNYKIPFWKRGEFEIPPFDVNDLTEVFLRNFIALEQASNVKSYFTSHALVIDRLINTPEDVKLLEKKGVIVNSMGCREEVANLFNNLCKNVDINCIYSAKDCVQVIKFHRRSWPKFLVKLRRDYFSNPWTTISVVAASCLFVLTLLQTIYTMRT